MTIHSFDRANLNALRPEIDAALAAVAEKHGITLTLGNIRFNGGEFRVKLEGHTQGSATAPQAGVNPQEAKWQKALGSFAATTLGFTADQAGKTFRLYGEQYVLVGFRPKAKAKVVARKPGRKSYVALPHQPVADALKEAGH